MTVYSDNTSFRSTLKSSEEDIGIAELLDRLRARGWRITAQRRVVAEVLTGEHVHLTAEAVHAGARARLPEISLATVYNTLNELVTMGEVLAVATGSGPTRYDPNVATAHQHLVCTQCGDVRDVVPRGQDELGLSSSERHGYRVSSVDIVFRGICADCGRANRDGARP